ncbi:MAG: redoxin domain-containing protein [Thermodesulfobacteriota bacterium]|nr:redoxin domain-containing protein [Thermodesulfobacteriota bacterium]
MAFQRDLEKFEHEDAIILGVSKDSMKTSKRFAKEYGIGFPLISDSDKKIRRLYGGGRVTYLIDKNGVIRFIQKGVPDNNLFLKELKRLRDANMAIQEGGSTTD